MKRPRPSWLRWLLRALCVLALIVVTITGVRIHEAGKLPDLQPWHRIVPSAEVSAQDLGEGFTLAEYLRREDALFREVRETIETPGPPKASERWSRYIRGSYSNPGRFPRDWNRTFERVPPSIRGGVLLLHGLTDSPYSMRSLANLFEQEGFYVLALRMPGHGTAPAALAAVTWEDWRAAARMGARHVRRRIGEGKPLILVGYSCGGGLAVQYALDTLEENGLPKPERLVLLSPLIGMAPIAAFSKLAALPGHLPPFEKARWLEVVPEYNPFKYNSFPFHAADQTYELTSRIQRQVERARAEGRMAELPPILTFQSVVDDTVAAADVEKELYAKLASNGSELVFFDVNRQASLSPFITSQKILQPSFGGLYRVTLVTNAGPASSEVVEKSYAPETKTPAVRALGLQWPPQFFSLSHIALPFPQDDPLYGRGPETPDPSDLRFGNIDLHGERNVLAVPLQQLMRISWNPFYPYLEERVRAWIGAP